MVIVLEESLLDRVGKVGNRVRLLVSFRTLIRRLGTGRIIGRSNGRGFSKTRTMGWGRRRGWSKDRGTCRRWRTGCSMIGGV